MANLLYAVVAGKGILVYIKFKYFAEPTQTVAYSNTWEMLIKHI